MDNEKELTPWQQYKKNLGETRPWDIIDPAAERATEEEANTRYSICLECPELIKLTKQCRKCSCFMKAKTKLQAAHCPLQKW